MDRLESEVVVVTGSGGMGLAIARRLGSGRQLVLADFSEEALSRAAAQLTAEGHAVHLVRVDVADLASVQQLAGEAARHGRFRILAHTAGVSPVQAPPERVVDVDVLGTAYVLDVFLDLVTPGAVAVCIASMAAHMVPPLPGEVERALGTAPAGALKDLPALNPASLDRGAAYSLAKRANQLRVAAASIAWGARGGRVVSISPGIISTPMSQAELAGESGAQMRAMIQASAAKRLGTPDDIAAAVEFLCSPAASFITGADLLVDGGVIAALKFAAPQ